MPLTDAIPSSAFDVLERNVQDTDKFVNQETGTFTNRFSKLIKPIQVIEAEANAAVISLGWHQVGLFADGFTYLLQNDIAKDAAGDWYRWNGIIPTGGYAVAAGTLPSSDVNFVKIDYKSHAELSDRNPADGSAHNADDIAIFGMESTVNDAVAALKFSDPLDVGSVTPPDEQQNDIYVLVGGNVGHYELVFGGGSQVGLPILSITTRPSGLVVLTTSIGSYYAVDFEGTVQEKFKLTGDKTSISDLSLELSAAISYQVDIGLDELPLPDYVAFNLTETISNTSNIKIHGNVDLRTSNPQNRYLITSSAIHQPRDLAYIGKLHNLANAVKRNQYGGRRPVVVFIGDSLYQGGHNYTDYNWPAKQIENEVLKAIPNAWCFNRAIAGSVASEVFSPIPAYVTDPSAVHAPGEVAWITDTGRTWYSYVVELDPDLVVVGFGMNDYGYNIAGYNELYNALTGEKCDMVMVSTPMRTTDVTTVSDLGTFPNNEFSNSSGRMVRKFAQSKNLSLIDANKLSNSIMNGVDVDLIRFKDIPSGQITTQNAVVTGSSATISAGGSLSSPLPSNGFAVTFTPQSNGGYIFVAGGRGPSGVDGAGVVLEITDTYIKMSVPNTTNTSIVEHDTYTISTIGSQIRFQYDGTFVQLLINDLYLERSLFILGANARDNFSIASSGVSTLTNLSMQSVENENFKKSLTTNQIFSGSYQDGGNNINHLTQIGSRAIFQPAICSFGEMFSDHILNIDNVLSEDEVTFIPAALVDSSSGSTIREGNVVTLNIWRLQGNISSGTVVGTLNTIALPNTIVTFSLVHPTTFAKAGLSVRSNGEMVLLDTITSSAGFYTGAITYVRSN